VNYFYGTSAQDAAMLHSAIYLPGSATNLFVDLLAEIKLSGDWYLDLNLRKTWLDTSISNSPLVDRHTSSTGLVAASYRFH
jgi:outer membrane protein